MVNLIQSFIMGYHNTKLFFKMTDQERMDFLPEAKRLSKYLIKHTLIAIAAVIFLAIIISISIFFTAKYY